MFLPLTALLSLAVLLLGPSAAMARIGGGQSFSGGGGGGYGGGSGGGGGDLVYLLVWLVFSNPAIGIPVAILVAVVWAYGARQQSQYPSSYSYGSPDANVPDANAAAAAMQAAMPAASTTPAGPPRPSGMPMVDNAAGVANHFASLQKFDTNLSEIAFTDFTYALFGRAHESRGRGDLQTLSPYLSPAAIAALRPIPPQIKGVSGVIVGGSRILQMTDPTISPVISIGVRFLANYTESTGHGLPTSYYTSEDWVFTRKRDLLSPDPDNLTALHCPKCGSSLEKKSDGSCAYCGVKITGGDFNWFVASINILERLEQGPLLTQDVPEEGTNFPTVYQPDLQAIEKAFVAANPDFNWQRASARFRDIFLALQDAWSSLRWEKARPYETDSVFQMHRYWIEAYQQQGLRNVLEQVQIARIEPVKFETDKFYDSITNRIFASMIDFTEDVNGKHVCGSKNRPRQFTEYWTFIRHRGAKEGTHESHTCPNCGAALDKVNPSGVCEYCGGKITGGAFDWVLSRIEQDEVYAG